jgi:hypothetical protein
MKRTFLSLSSHIFEDMSKLLQIQIPTLHGISQVRFVSWNDSKLGIF